MTEIIDEAGDFLIQAERYAEGLDLFRRAAERFPRVAVFHQGIGCCAGHLDLHEDAIAASRAALDLEPENQKFVNDLGWSLYKAGKIDEARPALERAVAMDPTDAQPRRTSGYVGVPMVLRAGHAAAGASRLQVLGLRADRRARYRAHTGFVNPEAPPDAVPRESIEVRTVALFAD